MIANHPLGFFEATNNKYHAMPGLSSTKIKDFCKSPAIYYAYHEAKKPRKKSITSAMEFGTMVHDILPPGDISDVFQIIPDDVLDKAGRRSGKAWNAYKEEQPENIHFVKKDDKDFIRCLDLIKNASQYKIWHILDKGKSEVNYGWEWEGFYCRARADRIIHDSNLSSDVIYDLKVTSAISPDKFPKQAWDLGWHIQAAWYQYGYKQVTGKELPFVFIAIQDKFPYVMKTYELDFEFMETGLDTCISTIKQIKERRESGVWIDDYSNIPITAEIPHYISRKIKGDLE